MRAQRYKENSKCKIHNSKLHLFSLKKHTIYYATPAKWQFVEGFLCQTKERAHSLLMRRLGARSLKVGAKSTLKMSFYLSSLKS